MAGDRLRMAVIGTGSLGRHHARHLGALDGVELVAVCDPDETRGRAAAELGGSRWVARPEALPDDLDAVSIAAPTPLHVPLGLHFLERGVHCLLEKPMAADLAGARRLVAAAEAGGLVVQVGHIERFNPVLDHLPRDHGAPVQIDCWRLAPHSGRSSDTSVVFDLMIHDLDLALWWAASAVAAVEARGGTLIGPLPDWASARIRFRSGAVANVTASRVAPAPLRRSILHFDGATADIDFGRRVLGRYDGGGASEHDGAQEEPLRRELSHFAAAVRDRSRPLVSHREGLAAVELAAQVLELIQR